MRFKFFKWVVRVEVSSYVDASLRSPTPTMTTRPPFEKMMRWGNERLGLGHRVEEYITEQEWRRGLKTLVGSRIRTTGVELGPEGMWVQCSQFEYYIRHALPENIKWVDEDEVEWSCLNHARHKVLPESQGMDESHLGLIGKGS